MKLRPLWVLLHRYSGLAMTVFFVVVGLTGSLLAFLPELEKLINPQWSVSARADKPLDLMSLLKTAEGFDPNIKVDGITLNHDSVKVDVSLRQPANNTLPYNQLLLNPYTGELLGRRHWGDLAQGSSELMAFIYKLHYSLALDDVGLWLLGITALVWTLDCFVGFYLTLPASKANSSSTISLAPRSLWQRWQPAWLIKWSASKTRITFDLHRAGGLWLWLALLVFAWSSVFMNLGSVYTPVMQTISEYHQPWTDIPDLPQPVTEPTISWQQAYDIAQGELSTLSAEQGIQIYQPAGFWINRGKGFYVYAVNSSTDIQDHGGQTRIVIDATTGAIKMTLLATGQYSGNTLTTWLMALHMANVWGLPYKIFVSALGLMIVMLAVTGVLIWLKKRR
jgi:uncharacterized iron-regulated membrane protein